MPTLHITNTTDWEVVAATTLDSTYSVYVDSNLTFTSNPTPIQVNDAYFDGNCYTITMSGSFDLEGLLTLHGGTIRDVVVDGGGNTLDTNAALVLNFLVGGMNQYGTLSHCVTSNATTVGFGGGITCNWFGTSGTTSFIRKCTSSINANGSYSGGIGSRVSNTYIDNCYFDGTLSSVITGGMIGLVESGTVTITKCYSNMPITASESGGMVGSVENGDTVRLNIVQCYHLGNITMGGGMLGRTEGGSENATIHMNDNYVAADITGNFSAGIIGTLQSGTVTINRTYVAGTIDANAAYIANTVAGGTITTHDCVFEAGAAPAVKFGTAPTQNNTSTDISDVENGSLPAAWSPTIWTAQSGAGEYATLNMFTNTSIWDGTYTSFDSSPEFSSFICATGGDPHVKPLIGKPYDLPHSESTFLLFDNCRDEDRLIIKGLCWYLPEDMKETIRGKIKYEERRNKIGKLIEKTTYYKYIKLEYGDDAMILDMDTLDMKEFTNENDLLRYSLPSIEFAPNCFRVSEKMRSKEGLYISMKKSYQKTRKTYVRTVTIRTMDDTVVLRLAKDDTNLLERNSIQIGIRSSGDDYRGALMRKDIRIVGFNSAQQVATH